MNPTVELVLKHKKANMRKSEFLMLEALKSAPHLNDSPGYQLVISCIWANKCDGSSVMMDPNAYPFHIKCDKHCIYVRGDIHFWLVHSVTHYLTGLFMPGLYQECWLTFEDLSQEMWWCQCKIHTHTPIHNIKCVAKTLFMLCMNVTSIVVGRRAWSIAYQHYSCPSMIKISNNWSTI